jgi:hypothetical protein
VVTGIVSITVATGYNHGVEQCAGTLRVQGSRFRVQGSGLKVSAQPAAKKDGRCD